MLDCFSAARARGGRCGAARVSHQHGQELIVQQAYACRHTASRSQQSVLGIFQQDVSPEAIAEAQRIDRGWLMGAPIPCRDLRAPVTGGISTSSRVSDTTPANPKHDACNKPAGSGAARQQWEHCAHPSATKGYCALILMLHGTGNGLQNHFCMSQHSSLHRIALTAWTALSSGAHRKTGLAW